ncbi:MAG: aconitate hydratase B, partial [Arcobacteraceae bacterium]|nr:aconitate hydratase B [Arcobacteraceae bacterium]
MALIEEYKVHTSERETLGVPPLPLTVKQTADLVELLKADNIIEADYLMDLLENRINPGVDDAAYVKAAFLNDIVQSKATCKAISKIKAIEILGKMMGGYNVTPLVDALKIGGDIAQSAANELKNTLLVYDAFNDVKDLMDAGNSFAKEVITSWANAEWFTNKPAVAEEMTLTVYKVPGETNTDDLSPAGEAFTRSDIPLHANSMLGARMNDPLNTIKSLKDKGHSIA